MSTEKNWSDRFDEIFVTAIDGSLVYNSQEKGVVSMGVKAFFQSELEKLGREILDERDNPHNMALLGADRKQNCESAVDTDVIIEAFKKLGVKIK